MRTTVRLDPHLMRAAKKLATDTQRTLTRVIEDALREVIARQKSGEKRDINLPISRHQGGLLVDLEDKAALDELLEGETYARLRR
jgi:predicted transcriptional regulator